MSKEVSDRLYHLLPSIYRILDVQKGEPLRALLRVIEDEMLTIEEDIEGLYDDWFIETCAPWVIPYIGDLLGVKNLHPMSNDICNLRSYVANTVAYRRRKGTSAIMEQISKDVTGWPARTEDLFEKITTTQKLSHKRLNNLQSPDIRDAAELELLGSPFEKTTHTIDIRQDDSRKRYNIPGIGIYLWRLQSYPLIKVNARNNSGKGYYFDPTGKDIQLFNRPKEDTNMASTSREIDLPCPLRKHPLEEELETIRRESIDGQAMTRNYFSPPPVFSVALESDGGSMEEVHPEEMMICNLQYWSLPSNLEMRLLDFNQKMKVAVDPERGRLMLMENEVAGQLSETDQDLSNLPSPRKVVVSYSYGFSGDIGAGPYDRSAFIRKSIDREVGWQVGVSQEEEGERIFRTISDAVEEWKKQPRDTTGLIAIMDSRTYKESIDVEVSEGSLLLIAAAGWPTSKDSQNEKGTRHNGLFTARMRRPHLLGDISVKGSASPASLEPGEILIDGLLVEGKVSVMEGRLGSLKISHCTFLPRRFSLEVKSENQRDNDSLILEIRQSICGGIKLPKSVPSLLVLESIIDHPKDDHAVDACGSEVRFEKSTILGKVRVLSLKASDSLFTDTVTAKQLQSGWIRYCYLPSNSRVPHHYRCQPNMALKDRAEQLGFSSADRLSEGDRNVLENRIRAVFTSTRYGHQGYAQLAQVCAREIRMGAENGSEIGVFCSLQNTQREANLRLVLSEYLPSSLDAGIYFLT